MVQKNCKKNAQKSGAKQHNYAVLHTSELEADTDNEKSFSPVKTRYKQKSVVAEMNQQQVELPVNVDHAAEVFVVIEVTPVLETVNTFQHETELMKIQIHEAEDKKKLEMLQDEN